MGYNIQTLKRKQNIFQQKKKCFHIDVYYFTI